MKKWECSVCGYIHEGEEPPEKCPVCGAGREKFFEVKAEDEDAARGEITGDEMVKEPSTGFVAMMTDHMVKNHLHPISVHSPNGIIPIAVGFFIIAVIFSVTSFETAALYNMIAVFLSMPVVILSGYVTWQKKYQGVSTSVFKVKIAASVVAITVLAVLIIWKLLQPDVLMVASSARWVFLLLSLLLLGSVGIAGHLGGQLVFSKAKK